MECYAIVPKKLAIKNLPTDDIIKYLKNAEKSRNRG